MLLIFETGFSFSYPFLDLLPEQIIENGYGYSVDGDVYFSVDKFPDYGRLSGRKLEDNRAGERVAVDSRKKHPGDFAMWKVVSVNSQKLMIMYALAV